MATEHFYSGAGYGDDLAPGGRVGGGRYLLKRLIGRGEISEVWLAREIKSGRDVALKFLPRAFLSDENLLERFRQESLRSQLVQHPHIVATREFVRDHQAAVMAEEYVDGWSLATLKVDQPNRCYRVAEIESWIHELGEAVGYAHESFGIVHGDLKPSNLLVSPRDGIKVSDLGFAALLRDESSRHGVVKAGSRGIGFLSPQQVMGGAPSKLDDVYALGATIFDLLTGTPPFYKGEVIAQICSLPAPGMAERLKELGVKDVAIPPVWEDTVAACLAKKTVDRPQSVDDVMRLLERPQVSKPDAPTVKPSTAEPPVLEPAQTAAPESDVKPPDAIPTALAAGGTKPNRLPLLLAGAFALLAVIGLVAGFWFVHWRSGATTPAAGDAAVTGSSPGSLDKSFNAGSGADDGIRCLVVQPDGKIIVGGLFSTFNGVPNRHIVRLNPDGSLDAPLAMQPPGRVHAVALQSDGTILLAGETMVAKPRRVGVEVIRLHEDGQREANWGLNVRLNAEVRALAVQPDGRILVGGSFTSAAGRSLRRLMRLNEDGTLDDTFNISGGASAAVWSVAVQPDGKILAAGAFADFNGQSAGHLVRLLPDGGNDPAFKTDPGADGEIMAVRLQPDGRILIGGRFTNVDGVARAHLARLNPDGTVDATFNPGGGLNGTVQSIAVQPDGKIIVGGGFDLADGESRRGVARFNADGRLDKSFNVGDGASGYVWSVALQPDGKILVAGAFDTFAGAPNGRIVRLNNDLPAGH